MKIIPENSGPKEIFDVIYAKRKFARIYDVSIDNLWSGDGPYLFAAGDKPPSKEVTVVIKIRSTKAARKILKAIEKHHRGPPLY